MLARRQLLTLGFSAKAIRHRVETGRLRPLYRGVYAVGWTPLTPNGGWMAAVLACGEGAVLSHRSAAELWGIGRERQGRIDAGLTRSGKVRRPGIKVRRRTALSGDSLVRRFWIPVTDPVQTLTDIATEIRPLRLERAVNEADKLELIDPEALRLKLDGRVGQPGVKTLRTMLDRHTSRLSDSDLEIRFRPLARAAALPSPCSKHWVLGYEVDFWFPDLFLVVETDGLRYHRTPSQQARMAKRDQKHVAAGLAVLRFTHWQIAYARDEVVQVLEQFRRSRTARRR